MLQHQSDLIYLTAFRLVCTIDRHLRDGTRHYRDARGRLLTDLGQVVEALLKGELDVSTT